MKKLLLALLATLCATAHAGNSPGDTDVGFLYDANGLWCVLGVASSTTCPATVALPSVIVVSSADSVTGAGTVAAPFELVGDSAAPGNTMCYGTNGSGTKGWYSCAAGSGTVTSIQLTSTGSTLTISPTSGSNPCTSSCVLDLETTTNSNIICAQALATANTTTGTTNETNLENCTITAGQANVTGAVLRITSTWYRSATTTDSTQFVVRMCTSSGCTSGGLSIQSPTDSTSGSVQYFTQTLVYITSSTGQLVPVIGSPSGTSGGSAPTTGTENMANTQFIAFNCKNVTSSADTCGIYTWTVELIP